MSFRVDTRARIPFAVLGALLLVTSTLYASTATPALTRDPVSPELVETAQTEARMALATAIREAGRDAARRPVLEPSEHGMGSILDDESTFQSYVRLLVALNAREKLESVAASRDGVGARVRLPSIDDKQDAARALESVTITRVSNNDYRIHVTGLRVAIERDGRRTDYFEYDTNVTMPIPALTLHSRVNTFETRVNNDLTDPGLARSLTSRLFAVTWARGYAQYGGAPIQNILANHHVEVLANDALLAQQAAVFGRSDHDARRATTRAATAVFVRDGRNIARETVKNTVQDRVDTDDNRSSVSTTGGYSVPTSFDDEQTYDVDRTADETFVSFVERGGRLDSVLDRVYRARVRADFDARYLDSDISSSGAPPRGAHYLRSDPDTNYRVENGYWTSGNDDDRTLRTFHGSVIETRTTTRYWKLNHSITTTTYTRQRTYRVGVDLNYRYSDPGIAPDRPQPTAPFGDEARSRLDEEAMDTLVRSAGGIDELAADAAQGDHGTRWKTVDIDPPPEARSVAYEQTADMRERVQDVSVTAETRSIASSANPASQLASKLRTRETSLVDPPYRYRSVRDRAGTAARLAYLQQLTSTLDSRSPMIDRVQQKLVETLNDRVIPMEPPDGDPDELSRIASSIDGRPTYLSVREGDDSAPAMAARNVNVFAVPYGDTADVITDSIFGGDETGSVSLRTAAQTVRSLDAVPREQRTAEIRSKRDRLRTEIASSLAYARTEYRRVGAEAMGDDAAHWAVDRAFDRWETPEERALAISNGRMATAIVAETRGERVETRPDLLEVKLRVVSTTIMEDEAVRIDESPVGGARDSIQTATNQALKESLKNTANTAAKSARKRSSKDAKGGLPAGLPLVPVPGYWYATANAWVVQVRGSYDRLTVRAPRAAPVGDSNGTVEYVRTDSSVSLDVDGDGTRERIGRNRPVSFSANTGVVIVVPPGKNGVGDVDGNADERSPGWGKLDG